MVRADLVVQKRFESYVSIVVRSRHQAEAVARHRGDQGLAEEDIHFQSVDLHVVVDDGHDLLLLKLLAPNLFFVGLNASELSDDLLDDSSGVLHIPCRVYNLHVVNNFGRLLPIMVLELWVVNLSLLQAFLKLHLLRLFVLGSDM